MKNSAVYFLLFVAAIAFSCSQTAKDKHSNEKPVESPDKILKNFQSWWSYHNRYVKLNDDFIPLDTAFQVIDEENFRKLLITGEYLPLRLISPDSLIHYTLYKLNASVEDGIKQQLKDWAYTEYKYFEMKGKPLTGFNYTDLNGKTYDAETTKNKIVVLKFWFIGCAPCIAEMPELNNLVTRYKNRSDIVFVSLAFDEKKKLEAFLKKKKFDYAVIPDQENYLTKDLNVRSYPTHLIINKQGKVVKVLNTAHELITALDQEAVKKANNQNI